MNHLGKHEQRALIEEGLAASSALVAMVAEHTGHTFLATLFWVKFGLDMYEVVKAWWKHFRREEVEETQETFK